MRFRTLILIAAVAGTLAVASPAAPSSAALPKLNGTVGPGFTIALTRFGKKVITLKHGTYSITVRDRSNIHNFHLRGPGGVNREITTIRFVGTKTAIVRLVKGRYSYVCDPHLSSMKGSFTVT